MRIPIAHDGWIFIVGVPGLIMAAGMVIGYLGWGHLAWGLIGGAFVLSLFMMYFFRDPHRVAPDDPTVLVSGADGKVRSIEEIQEDRYLGQESVRVSIFLSPMDVHINRAPLAGVVRKLSYTSGKRLFTIQNAASEYNEHSCILIEGHDTSCLVKQIVGPIVRRVVYWLSPDQGIGKGDRIGLMKFGSRLDMYFPKADVRIMVKKGDKVRAGLTPVAVVKKEI